MASRTAAGRAPQRGAVRFAPPFPDLLSVALLVALLAPVGVAFGRLSYWDRFVQPWPALLAGAACCGLAALARRPGWWVLVALTLGACAVVLTLYWLVPGPTLALRDEQTRLHMLSWWRGLRDGEPIYDNLAVDAWTVALAWLTGMWAAWAALRVRWHWLVVGAAGALLCWTVWYMHGRYAGALPLYAGLALVFVARLEQRNVLREAAYRGLGSPRQSVGSFLGHYSSVSAGALLLVGIAWILPPPHWRAPVVIHPPKSESPLSGFSIRPSDERSTLHDFGSTLPFGGAISLGDASVVTVDATAPGYLFGSAYDSYEGNGWTSSARAITGPSPGVTLQRSGAQTGDRLSFLSADSSSYSDSQASPLSVRVVQQSTVILAAGPPVTAGASASGNVTVIAQQLRGSPAGEYTGLVAAAPLQQGSSYTSSGLLSTASPDALRSAGQAVPNWVQQSYKQLPASLPQRVRDKAAQIAAGQTNDYDRAVAIQAYLRGMAYDESIAAPPPGEDGADYLLFVTGRGYCDYYASAMAVMLRSLGVPARVVAGYVMHEHSPSGSFVVRDHDAHAWTEVYFPGYGWRRFDPTPGGAGSFLAGQPGTALGAAAPAAPVVSSPTPAATATLSPASVDSQGATKPVRSKRSFSLPSPLWLLLPGGFLIGWLAYALTARRLSARRAVLLAWGTVAAIAGFLHRPRRRTETAPEYAAAVGGTPRRSRAIRSLAADYSRVRYADPRRRHLPAAGLRRRTLSAISALTANWLLRAKRGG